MKVREYMMVCPTAIVPLICSVCSKVMAIPNIKGRLPNRGLNRRILPYWAMLILLVT